MSNLNWGRLREDATRGTWPRQPSRRSKKPAWLGRAGWWKGPHHVGVTRASHEGSGVFLTTANKRHGAMFPADPLSQAALPEGNMDSGSGRARADRAMVTCCRWVCPANEKALRGAGLGGGVVCCGLARLGGYLPEPFKRRL